MNVNQQNKYGSIKTYSMGPVAWRVADCPVCSRRFSVAKRGNALADAARVRGLVMQHLRNEHPEALNGSGNEDNRRAR